MSAMYSTIEAARTALQTAVMDTEADLGPEAVEAGYADLVHSIAASCTPEVGRELERRELGEAKREIVVVGWDGRSNPMLRYADELHLPDSQRSIVRREPDA